MAIKKIQNETPSQEELALMQEAQDEGAALIAKASGLALGSVSGDADAVQLRLPYLRISHAQGALEAVPKGCLVLGDDNILAKAGEPIYLTVLTTAYYWKEYLSGEKYNPDILPRIFATRAEVLEAGGTTEWTGEPGNRIGPSFKIAISMKVIVRKPKDIVCGLFGIPIGGEEWAAAMWNVDKTSAGAVAPVLRNDEHFSLRTRGIYSGIYEVVTQSQKFSSGFSTYIPKIRLVDYHKDPAKKEIEELFAQALGAPADLSDAD